MIINTPGHTLFFLREKMSVDIRVYWRRSIYYMYRIQHIAPPKINKEGWSRPSQGWNSKWCSHSYSYKATSTVHYLIKNQLGYSAIERNSRVSSQFEDTVISHTLTLILCYKQKGNGTFTGHFRKFEMWKGLEKSVWNGWLEAFVSLHWLFKACWTLLRKFLSCIISIFIVWKCINFVNIY